MRTFLSFIFLLGTAACAGATTLPAVFLHQGAFGDVACINISAQEPPCVLPPDIAIILPNVAGTHLYVPWSVIESATQGVRDWTQVENAIRPWSAAGKLVSLSFLAVDEKADTNGLSFPSTPNFLLNPPAGTPGPTLVNCQTTSQNKIVQLPSVPVYWDPLFRTPWHQFIDAAMVHFANRPEIAYLRFGIGEGDESLIENMTYSNGGTGANPACTANWNAADNLVGGNGVYNDYLSNSTSLVTQIGGDRNNITGAAPLSAPMNDLAQFQPKHLQPQPHPYADQLVQAEAAAGMMPGNEGFGNQTYLGQAYSSKFGDIYTWIDPWFAQTDALPPYAWYLQTNSPQAQGEYVTLPQQLLNGENFAIGTFEIYEKDLLVAYDPTNSTGKNPYKGSNPSAACLSNQIITVLSGQAIPPC